MTEEITITLTEEQTLFAEQVISEGHYDSLDAVVADALGVLFADVVKAAREDPLEALARKWRE